MNKQVRARSVSPPRNNYILRGDVYEVTLNNSRSLMKYISKYVKYVILDLENNEPYITVPFFATLVVSKLQVTYLYLKNFKLTYMHVMMISRYINSLEDLAFLSFDHVHMTDDVMRSLFRGITKTYFGIRIVESIDGINQRMMAREFIKSHYLQC